FSDLSYDDKIKIIKKNSNWGRVICRCENVTEAEIINALSNPLGAKTMSSIKYRCRAGMGRCQGGFCTQHIVRILKEKYNINETDIKLKSKKSNLFIGNTREGKF
ncbi:MAG: (2Fe-2S)-binding protein, partial [Candidatus Lokiarchaeia archaeon]|nr:(2Fe-2S)-binding protein [Candidatus Lokiarchaeia archaeon]